MAEGFLRIIVDNAYAAQVVDASEGPAVAFDSGAREELTAEHEQDEGRGGGKRV